jgi:hypothetical protein
MALVTDYTTLQDHIADTLNRSAAAFTAVVPNFIQQFEAKAKNDFRLRSLTDRGVVSVSADALALPSDFYSLEDWYHDGDTYFGPIEIVSRNLIGKLKASYGKTGVPQFASIVDGKVSFAPVPDQAYNTKMTYWRQVTNLSATNTTNWLLDKAPDIYIYGSMVEAHIYLKDSVKAGEAQAVLDQRSDALHAAEMDAQFGGSIRRQYTPIGG